MSGHKFEFIPQSGSFIPLLQDMLNYVAQQCTGLPEEVTDRLMFGAKTILTELLTNAIKHSGTVNTWIRIQLVDEALHLTKTDKGWPLTLLQHPELTVTGNKVVLSRDAFHVLLATAALERMICFECAEIIPPGVPDISTLPEHFGFLMIARLSSAFYYQYQPNSGTNIFSVKLLLK